MNESTKIYRWLPWAVASAIAAGLVVVTDMAGVRVAPWELARFVAQNIVLDAWDGVLDRGAFTAERLTALGILLVLFVVGPVLWIFSEVRNHSKTVSTGEEALKKGIDWYAGVVIVLFGLWMTAAESATGELMNLAVTNERIERSTNQSEMRDNLALLGFAAVERYLLPQDLGGGSHNFNTIAVEGTDEPRPLRLEDISSSIDDTENTYILGSIESDSVITLYAVGTIEGVDPNFRNINGEIGKTEVAMYVFPETRIFEFANERDN